MSETDHKCRALLVDDDAFSRGVFKVLLQDLGVDVAGEAGNGDEALAMFAELKPDITFLDIDMPIRDGVQTLKDILAMDANAYVVMLTAVGSMDVADDCVEHGASDYIRKSAAPNLLRAKVSSHIDEVRAGMAGDAS